MANSKHFPDRRGELAQPSSRVLLTGFLAIRWPGHGGYRRWPINNHSVDDRRSLGRIEIPYRIHHPE
jgi:hypothetical protein